MAKRTKPRQRYWMGEKFWREKLAEWEQSGQTKKAFSEEQGFNCYSFYRWSSRLLKERTSAFSSGTSEEFLELRLDSPPEILSGDSSSALELTFPDGVHVRVPSGFDRETLRNVLTILEDRGRC